MNLNAKQREALNLLARFGPLRTSTKTRAPTIFNERTSPDHMSISGMTAAALHRRGLVSWHRFDVVTMGVAITSKGREALGGEGMTKKITKAALREAERELRALIVGKPESPSVDHHGGLLCSFCGGREDEVGMLAQGPGVAICIACTDLAQKTFADRFGKAVMRQNRFAGGITAKSFLAYAKDYGFEISPEQLERLRSHWRETFPTLEEMQELAKKAALEEVHRDAPSPLEPPTVPVPESRPSLYDRVQAAKARQKRDAPAEETVLSPAEKKASRTRVKGPKAPQKRTRKTPKGSNTRTR